MIDGILPGIAGRFPPWYVLIMADSYLGVLTRRGLELLVPETEHAERFLQRRLRRGDEASAVCCWAVLSDDVAARVRMLVGCGRYWEVLVMLNGEAQSLGTLLPEPCDDELFMNV